MLAARGLNHALLAEKTVIGLGARVLALAELFDRMLERIRPQLAFVVDYYNPAGMAFVWACRRRGIFVADLQHGVQGELNPAYGRLPPSSGQCLDLVPDCFWVWSEAEARAIRDWAGHGGPHRAVVGGNPWLDVWLAQRASFVLEANEAVRRLRACATGGKIALVTLQWGLSHAEQTVPLIEMMRNAGPDWTWWLRLHPVMIARGERLHESLRAEPGRVLIEEPSVLPLYALLRHVDVHVTNSSSVILEAADFGVASVVIGEMGAELFQQQILDGTAILAAHNVANQISALNAQAARRGVPKESQMPGEAALDLLLNEARARSAAAA